MPESAVTVVVTPTSQPSPTAVLTVSPTAAPEVTATGIATRIATSVPDPTDIALARSSEATPTPDATQPQQGPSPTVVPTMLPLPRTVTVAPEAAPTERVLRTLNVDAAGQGYDGANVRAEPSLEAEILGLLRNGERIQAERRTVRGTNGEAWYRVRYKGSVAYILGSLLSPVPPGAGGVPDASADEEVLPGYFPIYPAGPLDRGNLSALLPEEHRTEHVTFHYRPDVFSTLDIGVLAEDVEAALSAVEDRVGAQLRGPVDYFLAYTLFPPPHPGLRGYNRAGERLVFQLYDGSGTRLERQYLAAHELTHQIASDGIGAAASTMLSEGLAMDASADYLRKDGHVSLDGFSRAALREDKRIALTQLSDGTVPFMGRLPQRYPYDEAGSFVGFLVRTYGLPRFKEVYVSGDYARVYSKNLETLEQEWREYLLSAHAVGPFAPDSSVYLRDIEAVQRAYLRLYSVLEEGRPVPMPAYRSLDAARIAADRADASGVQRGLQGFEQALSGQ
ncbi:MAG: SH3 domain-containing protein [Chloroflexota bacterium]|nr:SH3 domain-containing protein [Chloroflexota bacterium]